MIRADVSDDGRINAADALLILQRSVGLPAVFSADAMEEGDEFPYFSRGASLERVDGAQGCIEYSFSGVDRSDYLSYCALLQRKGYQRGEQNTIGGNIYAAYEGSGGLLYTYYVDSMQIVRVVADPISPAREIDESQSDKRCDLTLAQLPLSYSLGSFGMSYVVTLEDGRFVMIDGGYDAAGQDHERLFQYLSVRNVRSDGIVIAAWFLTHEDADHYTAIHNFAQSYADQVTLERFFVNTPAGSAWYTQQYLLEDLARYGDTELVIPHTGQQFVFGGAVFEILYTHEDWAPRAMQNNNETSLVMRMTAGGQTVLWTGDIEEDASDILCSMYGRLLQSDMVQVAHHGYDPNTATKEFYRQADPSVLLWPAASSWFHSWRQSDVNRYLLFACNISEILVADVTVKELRLPYRPGSGLRQSIFNFTDGQFEEVPADMDDMLGFIFTQVYTPEMLLAMS